MTEVVVFKEIATACGRRFGIATLNAPAALNALSLAMVDRLQPQLSAWAADAGIVGVLLDGAGDKAGDKAFCAGGDLVELYQSLLQYRTEPNPYAQAFFEREYRLDHLIHSYPKPFAVWGHGIVMGGGIGLMMGASHRVVTPKSRLAMPEISIGLYPDVGGSWLLRRVPGRVGLFLALTGASINAADALHAGMADLLAPHEAKPALLEAVAATRWHGDARDAAQLTHLIEGLRGDALLPASNLLRHADEIRRLMGHDGLRDIDTRMRAVGVDGRVDDPWLSAAVASFRAGSPTSAALSFALWQRVVNLSLADVFRLEFNASLGCCAQHDFAEGIRALLIDKDRTPRWQPPTLDEVNEALIDAHLQPRHVGHHPLSDLL